MKGSIAPVAVPVTPDLDDPISAKLSYLLFTNVRPGQLTTSFGPSDWLMLQYVRRFKVRGLT